jgi:hypothetical protein
MTDKEIKKLKRADLLEILYYLQKEIEELADLFVPQVTAQFQVQNILKKHRILL